MTDFIGSSGNDIANSALGELSGFTGGTVADLTDGVGDRISAGDGDDFVFAGSAGDIIEGGDGFDLLNGAEGNDHIVGYTELDPYGSLIGDELVGNLGNDQLFGSGGADSLFGADDNDFLRGGPGADWLDGGNDDDAFFFAPGDVAAGETIDGGAGLDAIVFGGAASLTAAASLAGMEGAFFNSFAIATLSARQIKTGFGTSLTVESFGSPGFSTEKFRIEMGAEASLSVALFDLFNSWGGEDQVDVVGDGDSETIAITGSPLSHRMFGNGGNDSLAGGSGIDLLSGGAGNDVLSGGVSDDSLIGGGGRDTMSWSNATVAIVFTLPEGGEGLGPDLGGFGGLGQDFFVSIENVTGGTVADRITGNGGANTLQGRAGDDTLNGGAGDDRLEGGAGNDRFVGSTGDDVVLGDLGGDVLDFSQFTTAVTATMAAATFANGYVAFSGIETLIGGAAADSFTGNASNDTLIGQGGNDTLKGAAGNDRLVGAIGRDVLTGGTENDVFDYNAVAETGTLANTRDIVTDFVHLSDRIDFASIDAIPGGANDAFVFRGTQAFTAAGQVRLQQSGANTLVEINTVGPDAPEATIQLNGIAASTLMAGDFVL